MGFINSVKSAGMALALVALLSGRAFADVIDYTTSGTFSNTIAAPGVGLSFIPGAGSVGAPVLDESADFGTFVISGIPRTSSNFFTDFTIIITQTDPSSASGPLGGFISGSISRQNDILNVVGSSLTLPGGNGIGPVTYSLPPFLFDLTASSTGGAPVIEIGTGGNIDFAQLAPPVSTPLPKAASASLALLGLVGVGTQGRKLKRLVLV